MKSIKKIKKYGTAAVGTALLVGATLTGAAAANHGGSSGSNSMMLGDYPGNGFVAEDGTVTSSIVVGDDAKTVDVVGAVDIAGSLSQAAYDSVPVESGGSVSGAVDGETLDEEVIGTDFSGSADASDASFMTRETVQDDDGDDVFVTESASVSGVESRINGTVTDFDVQGGEVEYSATYSPGFEVNDTLMMLGEEFELVSVDSPSEIDLGSTMDHDNLQVDETVSHGPYTVKVEGGNSEDSEILVQVSRDGSVVDSAQLSGDETLNVDDDDEFYVTAETVFYNTGADSWSISLETTYQDMTLEEGEDLPLDENYEVQTISTSGQNNEVITGITVDNVLSTTEEPEEEDDETEYVEAGQEFPGPASYFGLHNLGLTNEATTDVEFGTETEVTFEDVNNQEWTFDMVNLVSGDNPSEEEYIGVPAADSTDEGTTDYYPVEVTSNDDTVELVHNEFDEEFDVANAPNTFTEDGDDTTNPEPYEGIEDTTGNGIAWRTVDTGYGFSVTIEWVNTNGNDPTQSGNSVDEVNFYSGTYAPGDDTVAEEQAEAIVTTEHGAELTQSSADPTTAGGDEATDVTDTGTSANTEVIELSEGTGAEGSEDTGVVQVWYDDDGTNNFFNDADDGDIGAVHYNGLANTADSAVQTLGDVEDGDTSLTHFGTSIDLESENGVTLVNPDEQRYQEVGIGRPGSGGGDSGETGMSMEPAGWPDVGALDTDESIGQRKSQDSLILVGGPTVNDLTAELAADGQTWDSSEWQNGGHEGESILQMTEGFEGGHALVVAGHSGEDTRVAAQYLANYESHSEELSGESQVTISTQTGNVVQ